MRATIDKAGRLVIPKELRDELGLLPGEVEVSAYGAGLRVEPVAGDESLDEREGRLVIPATGQAVDDNLVRALRDAGRK
jgi:AbrB family looped-hinge helix DNA binding protein